MKHQVTPLFSVPLYKTVLDPLDPMEESWIKNLKDKYTIKIDYDILYSIKEKP